jgi:hypothetical protein
VQEVYYPDNVRAPLGVAAPVVPTAGGNLVLGDYACTYDTWIGALPNRLFSSEPQGYFSLFGDGTYSWLDNGGSGSFAYDSGTGLLTWLDGPLADKLPERTRFRLNTATSQIDILFTGVYEWSCGHNL